MLCRLLGMVADQLQLKLNLCVVVENYFVREEDRRGDDPHDLMVQLHIAPKLTNPTQTISFFREILSRINYIIRNFLFHFYTFEVQHFLDKGTVFPLI